MRELKIKLSYRNYSDRAIAMSLLNEFNPIDKIIEKDPSREELLNFVKDSYDFCLNQARKWQNMIIKSKDYVWEIIKTNFDENNIKDVVLDHNYFKIYFHEDIKFDETLESYYKRDSMFYKIFDSYFKNWSTVHNAYRYKVDHNTIEELIDNVRAEFEEI